MARLKAWWRHKRPDVLSNLVLGTMTFIGRTVRLKYVERVPLPRPCIMCGWHGRSVLFAWKFRHSGVGVIISQSNDGEIQSRCYSAMGYEIIRGSTKRGGVQALLEAIKMLKRGTSLAITPDGPRGPSQECQPGIIRMAQKSGAPIVPAISTARPAFFAKSWDRFLVPIPFGRGVVLTGEPIHVPADATEEELERIRVRVQEAITAIQADADRMVGYRDRK